jgi:hypothetical protein
MRDFTKPRTFIFSAEGAWLDDADNAERTKALRASLELDGIPFSEVLGKYGDTVETSFIVTGASNEKDVAFLAAFWEQHSYLLVAEHDRTAYLVHVNSDDHPAGYHEHLGTLECVGVNEPEGVDGWTRVHGVYYVVTPSDGVDLPEGL